MRKSLDLLGYRFHFVQLLIPETDEQGRALKFYPQKRYKYKECKRLLKYGAGAFCRFSVEADEVAGVYVMTDENCKILYIGQTCNLRQRFNNSNYGSYGFITPAACYVGGQSTNCKINKFVLRYFEKGSPLRLFFMVTENHKEVEGELLQYFKTPYNAKN